MHDVIFTNYETFILVHPLIYKGNPRTCAISSQHVAQIGGLQVFSPGGTLRNLKGELGLFLTPVLTLWGGSHIARHVWRWFIVP